MTNKRKKRKAFKIKTFRYSVGCAPSGARTLDTLIKSQVQFPLFTPLFDSNYDILFL